MTALIVIAGICEVVAIWCGIGLWRSRASILKKLLWSLLLLVRVVGPVFYGGMFEVPAVQSGGRGRLMSGMGRIHLTGQAINARPQFL